MLFLALTLFIAMLTKSIFAKSLAGDSRLGKRAGSISRIAFWSVFGLMTPFLMSTAGISMVWLYKVQISIANTMKSWPVWFELSLCMGLVFFVIREVPKVVTGFRTLIQANDL
jgi:hypothetical protein